MAAGCDDDRTMRAKPSVVEVQSGPRKWLSSTRPLELSKSFRGCNPHLRAGRVSSISRSRWQLAEGCGRRRSDLEQTNSRRNRNGVLTESEKYARSAPTNEFRP